MPDKFCVDCKNYYLYNGSSSWAESCHRTIISPVYGETTLKEPPDAERSGTGGCGPDGKFFEPKPIKPVKVSFFKRLFKSSLN